MAAAAAAAAAASVGAADDSGVLVDAPLAGESHLDDIVSLSLGPVKSAVDEDASVDLALRAFFFSMPSPLRRLASSSRSKALIPSQHHRPARLVLIVGFFPLSHTDSPCPHSTMKLDTAKASEAQSGGQISIALLKLVSEARNEHGMRQLDYERYR